MPKYWVWFQWSGVVLGGIVFYWLSVEDTTLDLVTLLSVMICAWASVSLGMKKRWPSRYFVPAGLLAGLCTSLVASFLMIFKSGLHSHAAPDFVVADFVRVLSMAPIWGLSGFLVGWGLYLWRLSRKP